MKFVLHGAALDGEDETLRLIDRLVDRFADEVHRVEIPDADLLRASRWYREARPILRKIIMAAAAHTPRKAVTKIGPHARQLDVRNLPEARTADKLAHTPLTIIVEDRESDGVLLEILINELGSSELRALWVRGQATTPRAIEIDTAGGLTQMRQRLRRAQDDAATEGRPLRAFFMCDSDRRWPDDRSCQNFGAIVALSKDCAEGGVPLHVLRKRAAENYIPDDVVEAVRDDPRNASRVACFEAFLQLTPVQRDHFPVKDGLSAAERAEALRAGLYGPEDSAYLDLLEDRLFPKRPRPLMLLQKERRFTAEGLRAREENPEITPQVVHLTDLLKRAKEGRLRIPHFQRDFVWRRQDIVDLFDSIAKQYPIGTLFLWSAQPVPGSRQHIGPLSLPVYGGETSLVLDGQQRLTTLVGVLLAGESQWSTDGDDDPDRWRLFYDAKSNVFTHKKPEESPPPYYVPVPALLNTMSLYRQVEEMMKLTELGQAATDGARENVFAWGVRAQEVAQAIQQYRIPLVEIKTNNLSIAVESFSRLNKKGRGIGQDEMFSALTYIEGKAGGFNLSTEIDVLQSAMKRSDFGEVERTILLRAVLTAAGLDMYRTDWTRLGDQIKQDVRKELPRAVAEADTGLASARRFLGELGVLNARMLPYSMQLVALSAFYGRCHHPTTEQIGLLKRWFWSSSFAGWFGSGNPARVRRLVDELRDKISKDPSPRSLDHMDVEQPALPTPLRFDMRSARVRAMLCVLLARRPRQPDGSETGLVEAARMLFEKGPEAMGTLCATVSDKDLRSSPANKILDVAPAATGQAKNWLLALNPAVRDQVLISHAIEPETMPLLSSGNNDEFLQRRLTHLSRIERDFMQQVGITPPETDAAALAPIDADDLER